ncbi:uncharacterized protein LOC121728863 [Aricia agestis]|uniref:uncharacterized protein LOC121728863 n=1 Tax=Aricia agestis TaxID=91739 RepID=UPI001C20B8AF|nr:uncharacterized protein LOC121728863 [Aricia agestis]
MRNVEAHLLGDKMDEAVTHYINSQPPEAVHVDANALALNIQDDGGSRVVTLMHPHNFQPQMCRQVSVGEQVSDGPWVEDILDAEGRLAVLMAHLAQNARASHHQTHAHQKISTVRNDVDGNVMLDSPYNQTLEQNPDAITVEVPSLPTLPPLQDMKRCPETNWFEKDKTDLKNNTQMLPGQADGMLEMCAGGSPAHNKLHSKKSLPHKKRISKKLKRNNGGSTPQQELVVINCGEEGPHEEILPDTFATPPTHQMRPLLICQICGEFYGEEQLKFYHHLKEHYEPHTTIIIENPVPDLNIDKMNTCIVDNVATLPDSIVELSLENTVPKTIYQDKHILYNDKSLYSNKYTMSLEKEIQEANKADIYTEDLEKLGLYTCVKCNKSFKKQRQCEAHIKEAHSNHNQKLEDMGEFSETEDLMEGIHVAVEDPDTYDLPHLVVDNGHVHQEHVRTWYMRSGTPTMCECGGVGYCDACTHGHPQLLAGATHMETAPVTSQPAVTSHGPHLDVHAPPSRDMTHAPMHATHHEATQHESILPHSVSQAAVSPHVVMSNAVTHAVSSHSTMPSNVSHNPITTLAPSLVTNQRVILKEEVLQGIFESEVQNQEVRMITDSSIIESDITKQTESRVKSARRDTKLKCNLTENRVKSTPNGTNSTANVANSTVNGSNTTANDANSTGNEFNSTANELNSTANELNSTANELNSTENGASSNENGEKKPKKYECAYCSRVFDHRNSLLYHVHMHNGRQQVCRDCGKSFYTANALKIHKRVHSDYRPCKCEECGKEFKQWSDLKYHKASIHSNQKNYKCDFCGKEFARRYSLNIHRRIHTGERNYKCDYCAMTFRASSYRLSHMRTHTGHKPHQCPHCDKRFGVAFDLRRHMKVHDKQRLNEPKSKSKTIAKDTRTTEKVNMEDAKTDKKSFEESDPKNTRLPVLKSLLDKPTKSTKKPPKKAPNVTVQGKGQFKLEQNDLNIKEEYFKDVYEYKDDTPKKSNYAEEKSRDKNFTTLRPLFKNQISEVEIDRPDFSRETTDGKLQIYTQVERKEFTGPIISNAVSLCDFKNLEREVTRDRGDLHSEAVESGFFDRLTSFYNIPAV